MQWIADRTLDVDPLRGQALKRFARRSPPVVLALSFLLALGSAPIASEVGLLGALLPARAGGDVLANGWCGTEEISISSCLSQPTGFPTESNAEPQARSPFFDLILDAFIDTPHFRLHYSTVPGEIAIQGSPEDVAVDGDLALVAAGDAGLKLVNISIPGRPSPAGSVAVPGHAVRVVVAASRAYVANTQGDLQILRLSGSVPSLAGSIHLRGSARGVAVADEVALVAVADGVDLIDVSNPDSPVRITTVGLSDDAVDVTVASGRACVAMGESGLVFLDISSPAFPAIEATLDTPGVATGVAMTDSLVVVADGRGGILIVRAIERGAPKIVGALPSEDSATGVTVDGRYAYVIGSDGELRVIYFARETAPREIDRARFGGPAQAVALAGDHAFVAVAGFGLEVANVEIPPGESLRWFRPIDDMIQGWPDTGFRDTLAVAFEHSYTAFTQTLGFQPPLPDGANGGGMNLIDCYIYHLPDHGGLAYSHPETLVITGCEHSFSGYLGFDNAAVTLPQRIKDIAAHELFHLVQYTYDRFGSTWFLESTAAWAERRVWPTGTLGAGTGCWFAAPYLPLWAREPSCRTYGSLHFWAFEEETANATFVPRVFERCCSQGLGWLNATKQELTERGRDFNRSLIEFAIWNYATGERDDGRHYAERVLSMIDFQAEHEAYPVEGSAVSPSMVATSTGANYVRFHGPGSRDTLRVLFDGDARLQEWRKVAIVATRAPNVHEEQVFDLDENGDCQVTISNWPTYADVCMIVVNYDTSGSVLGDVDYRFTYSAYEEGSITVTGAAPPAPNPTQESSSIRLRIAEDRLAVRLDIYDASGRLVRRLTDGEFERGDYMLVWNGTGEGGFKAPTGVYFYKLDLGRETHRGRLMLLR